MELSDKNALVMANFISFSWVFPFLQQWKEVNGESERP
jgi:hypothetical protein